MSHQHCRWPTIDPTGRRPVIIHIAPTLLGLKSLFRLATIVLLIWSIGTTYFEQLAFSQTTAQSDNECQSILKTHGFLSRAQFQCHFSGYSSEMVESARQCAQRFNETFTKELLNHGMTVFDENEQEKGHKSLCEEILANFPGIVRN
jgi:hypothetical protein